MKKRTLFFKLSLLAFLAAAWTSCSKGNDIVEPDGTPGETNQLEQVCKQIAEVHDDVLTYYSQCKSITELKQYEEQIRSMKHVKDVYFTNISMFVDVEGFGPISFGYFPNAESPSEEELMKELSEKLPTRAEADHPMLNLQTAVIANQQHFDEKMSDRRTCANFTKKMFESYGFTVAPINIAPSVDFFEREMFDYDIVFILTHGEYDSTQKLHWLLTGETQNDNNSYAWYEWILKSGINDKSYVGYPSDKVSFVTYTEIRNGEPTSVTCAKISEKLIQESQKSFVSNGKAIVFNMACQSVMGPNPETSDSINYSMAQIFVDKGAGAYLGYDQSNCTGQRVGVYYFLGLVSGMSTLNAYNDLTFWDRHNFCQSNKDGKLVGVDGEETNTDIEDRVVVSEHWADLLIYPDNNMAIANSYLMNPKVQLDKIYPSITNNNEIELKASSLMFATDYKFLFGFDISETDDFQNAKRLCSKHVGEEGCTFSSAENRLSFNYKPSTSDGLKLNTRYYCRAFFFNGYDYYYSNTESFINRTQNGGGTIPDVPGTDF